MIGHLWGMWEIAIACSCRRSGRAVYYLVNRVYLSMIQVRHVGNVAGPARSYLFMELKLKAD